MIKYDLIVKSLKGIEKLIPEVDTPTIWSMCQEVRNNSVPQHSFGIRYPNEKTVAIDIINRNNTVVHTVKRELGYELF